MATTRVPLYRRFAWLAVTLLACGGGDGPSVPAEEPAVAAAISFSTPTAIVGLRAQVRLDLRVRDAENHDITTRATVQWSSSSQAVATVDATGLITGLTLGGTTTITATSNGLSATIALTVTPARIEILPAVSAIPVTTTLQLSAAAVDFYGTPVEAGPITWASGNPSVASIDQTGFVRGLAAGSSEITASAGGRTTILGLEVGVPSVYDGEFFSLGTTAVHITVQFGRVQKFDASLHPTPQCPMSVSSQINVPIGPLGTWNATLGASPGGTAATTVNGTFGSPNSVTGSVFGTLAASCQYGQLNPVSANLGTFVAQRQ